MIHLLDPKTLKQWLANDEVFLVDVREQGEYNDVNIKGSTLIPVGGITLDEVIKKNVNNKKIAIHCKLGGRSMTACKKLIAENPEIELWNVEGGITAWLNMGSDSENPAVGGCSTSGGGCSSGAKKTGGCSA